MYYYLSYTFEKAQEGMMNIFLLFLTTLFMIGYYVMTSPSQNTGNTSTENIIELSDLRSMAECVTAEQNAVINGEDYDNPCVARYGVESFSFCMNENYTVSDCNVNDYIYVITKAAPIAEEKYGSMLHVLELFYQESGTFGIFVDSSMLLPNSVGDHTVNSNISSEAELVNGNLTYIMQNKIPSGFQTPSDPNDPDTCPNGTKGMRRYGRWWCVPYNQQTGCTDEGSVYVPSLGACVSIDPVSVLNCTEIDNVIQCCSEIEGETICQNTPISNVQCSCPDDADRVLNLNLAASKFECICTEPEENPNTCPENVFVIKATSSTVGKTVRVPSVSCGSCERPVFKDCEIKCIPDMNKINSRTCYDGDPNVCKDTEQCGIYFGFTSESGTKGMKDANGNDVDPAIIERFMGYLPHHDKRFHSMRCGDLGGLRSDLTVYPYTAVCKNSEPFEGYDEIKEEEPNTSSEFLHTAVYG